MLCSSIIVPVSIKSLVVLAPWRHDPQHFNIQPPGIQHIITQYMVSQHNHTQHNDPQNSDVQHEEAQQNNIQHKDISIMTQHNKNQYKRHLAY